MTSCGIKEISAMKEKGFDLQGFCSDVCDHKMEVFHDHGMNKRIRFTNGGKGDMMRDWFDIMLWPGRAAIVSNLGGFLFNKVFCGELNTSLSSLDSNYSSLDSNYFKDRVISVPNIYSNAKDLDEALEWSCHAIEFGIGVYANSIGWDA